MFPCKGHAGTQNPLIPCKTPANPPRAGTCRSRGRCDTWWQPRSRGSCRQRGSGELYQEQDLGLWPGRTKPEFLFHSQPLSASHICEGADTTLKKSAFFWGCWGRIVRREEDSAGALLERGLGWNRGPTTSLGSGMNPLAQGWVESQSSQAEVLCLPGTQLHTQPAKKKQSASFPVYMEKNIGWAAACGLLRESPLSQVVFQVRDGFLKLSQSLMLTVVLAWSRQTLGLPSKEPLWLLRNQGGLGFFQKPICCSSGSHQLILRVNSMEM